MVWDQQCRRLIVWPDRADDVCLLHTMSATSGDVAEDTGRMGLAEVTREQVTTHIDRRGARRRNQCTGAESADSETFAERDYAVQSLENRGTRFCSQHLFVTFSTLPGGQKRSY